MFGDRRLDVKIDGDFYVFLDEVIVEGLECSPDLLDDVEVLEIRLVVLLADDGAEEVVLRCAEEVVAEFKVFGEEIPDLEVAAREDGVVDDGLDADGLGEVG